MATTKVSLGHDSRMKRPWVVRWFGEYDPATEKKRRYCKAFRLKRDAERFRAEKQAEFDKGGQRDRPVDVLLGDFSKKFVATCLRNHSFSDRQCHENTIRQLREHFGASCPLRRIRRQQAEEFIVSRIRVDGKGKGRELSGWSRAQHLKHCKAMWRRAVVWGMVRENVFDHIRSGPKLTRPWHHLTPVQFRELLKIAPDVRWRAIYWLLYGCGLRFGEAFNLTWSDIDFERGRVHVRNRAATADLPPFVVKADGRGCTSKERSVPMPKPVVDALSEWQVQAPEGVSIVLLTSVRFEKVKRNWQLCQAGLPREGTKKPRPWQNRDMVNNVLRDMKAHARRAKLKLSAPLTVHTLRKSFGQNHADDGTPIHVLQQLMGHSNITTTRAFYIRVSDASEIDATRRYERLLAGAARAKPKSKVTLK